MIRVVPKPIKAKPTGGLIIIELLILATFGLLTARAAEPGYCNPIIHADYSDPDVIRVGTDYYLIASSFSQTPGIPVLHSYDLVNWRILTHAVSRLPAPIYDLPQPGKGVWAPSIRYHAGEFWIYWGDPDLGIFIVKASSAAGPWGTPVLVKAASGWIDPCPFWDGDGQAYLIHAWAKSRVGFNSILTLHRMSADGRQILDEGVTIFDGHADHPTIEGPKMYKRDGTYYIFAPAGGVRNGWQTVLRSKNIYGPYADRVVLEQGTTNVNGPHQGAWVTTAAGEDWFIHFQDKDAYGRIVHLQPLQWSDGWPMIGIDRDSNGVGEPVANFRYPKTDQSYPKIMPQTTDDFEAPVLQPQWQWRANGQTSWYALDARPGHLRLYCPTPPQNFKNLADLPNLLSQKFPAETFEVTAKIAFASLGDGGSAGLIIIGDAYAALTVTQTNASRSINQVVCLDASQGSPETLLEKVRIDQDFLFLKVTVGRGAICNFSYSYDDSDFRPLGGQFPAVKGKWVGAQVGLFATTSSAAESKGYVDCDFFRVITDDDE